MTEINGRHPDWGLLTRVVQGVADQNDAIQLERWIGGDVARRQFVESVRTLWQHGGTSVETVDVDDALERIKGLRPPRRRVLRFPGAMASEEGRRRHRVVRLFLRGAIAAGIAAAAVLGFRLHDGAVSESSSAEISEVSTRRAERADLRLPDGTRLVLGPASRVRYRRDYGVERRELTLEGQALLVVTHDERRPFVVHTRRLVTTDLGTTFVVRDYGEDAVAEVMVSDGKAAVAWPGATGQGQREVQRSATTLEAGDLAVVAADGRVRTRHGVSAESYLAWSQGRLVFDDTPLGEVVAQLRRWYDIDARVTDSLAARRRLTASYSTEPLADVLSLIAASLDLELERHGQAVLFHARGAVPARGVS